MLFVLCRIVLNFVVLDMIGVVWTLLYYIALYRDVLCCIMLFCLVLCWVVSGRIRLDWNGFDWIVSYCIMWYVVVFCIVLCCLVLYCIA